MFKNVASQKFAYFAFDITTGAPKTGDAANISGYVSKDYGAVTQLTDTSATEMDATNAKGWYLFDVAQAETNADACLFTGKSSTANISVVGQLVYTVPPLFTSLSVDSNGRVDVIKVAGTTQTARDIGASVLLSSGTGTGQVSLSSGLVDITQTAADKAWSTAARTLTAGTNIQLPSNGLANVTAWTVAITGNITGNLSGSVGSVTGLTASDVGAIKTKTDFLPSATAGAAGGVFIAGTNAATTVTTSFTTTFTGNLTGSVGSVSGAVGSVTGNVGGNVTGTIGGLTAVALKKFFDTDSTTTYASAVAGSVVKEIASNAAGSGLDAAATRAALGMASANLDTQFAAIPSANACADALLNRDMSTGTDSGSPTVRTPRQALRFLRNKWANSAGTLTVYKEDDTTASWTATVATDAAAVPIVGNDPA